MSEPTVLVSRDAELLAQSAAARLVIRLVDAQAARGSASVVLTGGGIGTATLAAVAHSPARDAVDWGRVDVWWGDERFVPVGSTDRNERAARAALLDAVPLDSRRIHPMPAADGDPGLEEAAARYAAELATAAPSPGSVPSFDVLLLGVGPDGHVASLFPEMPGLQEARPVAAVRDAPKPPPNRISLTFPAIRAAREVWLLAAGGEKAAAVRLALTDADERRTPAAGARGRDRTLWLLDRAAAAELPPELGGLGAP